MDCVNFSFALLAAIAICTQPLLALGSKHLETKKWLRLLDNSVTGLSNNSRMLPFDGSTVSVQTTVGRQTRLYLDIVNPGRPLAVRVEPLCGLMTEWSIFLLEHTSPDDGKKTIDVVHPLTKQRSHVKIIDTVEKGTTIVLAEYSTKEVAEFRLREAPAGLYIITLSTQGLGTVDIAAFREKNLRRNYPIMPVDRKISMAKSSDTTISFYWDKATLETESKNSAGVLRYCAVVNGREALPHYCDAERLLRKFPNLVYFHQCFDGRNEFTLTRAFSNMPALFVNVFAVHPDTNKTLAYEGLEIVPSESARHTQVMDGTVYNGKIQRGKGYEVIYYVKAFQGDVKFSLVSCDFPLAFCVATDGKVIRCREVTQSVDTFVLRDAKAGTYMMTLTSSKRRGGQFRLFVSGLGARQPFPNLPIGRVVKEWPKLRTTQSVTVSWFTEHGRQQYCLYVRPMETVPFYRKRGLCWRPQDVTGNERVYCTYKRVRRGEKDVYSKTVKNLQPCTKYEFVVQVKKARASESLMYKPVRVITKCKRG